MGGLNRLSPPFFPPVLGIPRVASCLDSGHALGYTSCVPLLQPAVNVF